MLFRSWLVGATTLDEYRKYIEKDAALERRFQQVFVGEPSVEDAIGILRGLKERYEVHHGNISKRESLRQKAKNIEQEIYVKFIKFLRENQNFTDPARLKEQILKDVAEAERILQDREI